VSRAQVVRGVLISATDSEPVPYGTVLGPDSSGRFANAQGQFALGALTPGRYRLRARMLGYSPLDTTVAVDSTRALITLRMRRIAIQLVTIPIHAKAEGACVTTGRTTTNPQLAAVFEQLDQNVDRYNLLLTKYPFRYRREEVELVHMVASSSTNGNNARNEDSTTSYDTVTYDSRNRRPYQPGSIVYHDTTLSGRARMVMYLPTFGDLADPAFDAAHCFAYMGERKGEIRIDFRPAERIVQPDVAGSVYLDATRYIVRRADFHLTKPRKLDPPVAGFDVQTTFQEIVPAVPILSVVESEEPLTPLRDPVLDLNTRVHPLIYRTAIERDRVIDHVFLADTIGSLEHKIVPIAGGSAPVDVVRIDLSCSMPASFETTDVPIYATLTGDHAAGSAGGRILTAVRHQFHLPDNLSLPVYGYEINSKVTPTMTGQVSFSLSPTGHITSVEISATSLTAVVDTILVRAVRAADSAQSLPTSAGGHYALALSSAPPLNGTQATEFAAVAVPVTPLAHKASLNIQKSTSPQLPAGNGTFEFVVDERGRPIVQTMRTVTASSETFAEAVANSLTNLQFDPAVTGTCPIKQVVQQPFRAAVKAEQ
jgi:hypothetical protein